MRNELQELFQLAARHFLKKYKAKGSSQGQLAEEIGITQSYLSSVVNGSRPASLDLQISIAKALYGPYDQFLAIGRNLQNGLEPEEKKQSTPEGEVETLIARITHYVIDHKRVAQELEKTRNFYEQIVEGILTGVFVTDARDQIYFINNFMVEHAGVPREQIIGTNMITAGEKFKDGQFEHILQYYLQARETLKPHYFENVQVTTPAGRPVYQTGWMIPQVVKGQYNGMIMTINDATKSQELSTLLTLTLENTADAIGVAQQKHPGGEVVAFFHNQKMRQLFNLEPQHPNKSLTFEQIWVKTAEHIKNREEWENSSKTNIETGRTGTKFILEHINGKQYHWMSKALTDQDGNYCGRYVTVTEIKEKA